MMIELAKHIEYLLLENDCVVIPSLGGFIAHYQPAHYEESEGIFLPPIRSIGFNPQLTMNDGLLVQSYMQAYHTDFPDATRKIEEVVEKMKDHLYAEGFFEIHNIGMLRYNIYGSIEFEPNECGILSPSLYGLDSFSMPLLKDSVVEETIATKSEELVIPAKKTKTIELNTQWIGNIAAVAIAFILFFALSAPVENTYIDKGSYASLGTDCLFDAIRSHSMATSLNNTYQPEITQKKDKREIKPIAVKVEKVAPKTKEIVVPEKVEVKEEVKVSVPQPTTKVEAPAKEKQVAPKNQKSYHIIVASLTTSTDAKNTLSNYKNKGYGQTSVLEGNGRYRISLYNYADKNTAYSKLNELKQNDAFKNAWILTSK